MGVFDWPYVDLGLLLTLVLILLYIYVDSKYNHWVKRAVPSPPVPSLIYGHTKNLFFSKGNIGVFHKELYDKYPDAPYVGYYEFQRPVLLVKDSKLVQEVLVEKFNCFGDNKFQMSEKNDFLFASNPFIIKGPRWKENRSEIAPGFTASKIRALGDIIKSIYKDMTSFIDKDPRKIDLHDLSKRFTTDATSAWGLGIQAHAFDEVSVTREMYKLLSFSSNYTLAVTILHPTLAYLLKLRLFPKDLESFIFHIVRQCAEPSAKGQNGSLLSTLITNLRRKGETDNTILNENVIRNLSAHFGVFYLDSYETTARVLDYTIYNLMLHPDIQEKLRNEILDVRGDFTVDVANKLEYLDMVVSECLRMGPAVPMLGRICTRKCKIGNLELEPGTDVVIPVLGLHYDPVYYPDPEIFNPENFSEENNKARPKYVHLPFGHGPRICIGMKYALAALKLILCYLLRDYQIIPSDNCTNKPITPHSESIFIYLPDSELFVQFKKIKSSE